VEERLRCRRRADVLDPYEPIVVLAEVERRETSLSNERSERPAGGCYRRACIQETSWHDEEWPGVAHQKASGRPLPAGADDGPIQIAEYDPRWPACYAAERERLAPILPGVAIHHIGSTAVPKLAAKPVIDMMALVDDLRATVATVIGMAGYRLPARFNRDLLHRRFLCYPDASYRTHHLHLVDEREALDRCLRFRDLLRRSEKLAAEYADLKRVLAVRFGADRLRYTEAKTSFIEEAETGACVGS
jgi:GrpB-like predicted nucleotidyltransferase (UPF0157 family)